MRLGHSGGWRRSVVASMAGLAASARAIVRAILPSRRYTTPVVLSGKTMGTYYRITLAGRLPGLEMDVLQSQALAPLETVEALMSVYRPESEVSRLNASGETDWLAVSEATARVIHQALDIARRTDGAYDITAGRLVKLWGFGTERRSTGIPDEAQITEAKGCVGPDCLEVRLSPPGVRKTKTGVQVDLASIAKGFAVDLVAEALDRCGVRNYCVDVGGEIRARGWNPFGAAWQIAIETPVAEQESIQRIVPVRDGAVATSGDYRICFEEHGVRYSHIIDPRTGCPIRHDLASVTVLDSSCARADAWATALMVAGPERGYDLAEANNLPVLFILRTMGGFIEKPTAGFPKPPSGLKRFC
jgi:FAD:protein FMN transferase